MAHEIVEKWRALQKAPRVPRAGPPPPPNVPTREPSQLEITSRQAPRIPQRRELTAQEMGSLYPELVSKRPELLKRLSKRGVTYYIDPKADKGGTYSPSSKELVIKQGMPAGIAAHEVVHASMATSWVNPVRFLVDKNYRAARASDLVISGNTPIGQALRLYLYAAGGDIAGRVQKASMGGETFAIGAYGVDAYPGLPVDYSEAESLFGGSFEGR